MNELAIGILGSLIATLITMSFGLYRYREFFLPYLLCETFYRNKTADEIKRQRANSGEPTGVHSGYLLGHKRTGPEPPPFYE